MALQRVAFGALSLKPSEFWDLTYAEFCLACEGFQDVQKKCIVNAWYTGMFVGRAMSGKRYPDLKKYISDRRDIDEQDEYDKQKEYYEQLKEENK